MGSQNFGMPKSKISKVTVKKNVDMHLVECQDIIIRNFSSCEAKEVYDDLPRFWSYILVCQFFSNEPTDSQNILVSLILVGHVLEPKQAHRIIA